MSKIVSSRVEVSSVSDESMRVVAFEVKIEKTTIYTFSDASSAAAFARAVTNEAGAKGASTTLVGA